MRKIIIIGAGATYGASTINPSFKPPLLKDFYTLFNYGNLDNVRIAYTELIQRTETTTDIEKFYTLLCAVEHIARVVEPEVVFPSLENRCKIINSLEVLAETDPILKEYLTSAEDISLTKIIFQYFIEKPHLMIEGNPRNLMTFIQRAIYEWCYRSIKSGYCAYHSSVFKELQQGDAVVSFNYDEICDITLYRLSLLNFNSFDGLGYTDIVLPDDVGTKNGITLLKIHGSFNWFTDPTCYGQKIVYLLSPGVSSEMFQKKLNDKKAQTPFPLILPYYLKKYTYRKYDIFRKHLKKLYSLLEEAEEVFLVGKSFMNSDNELNNLIRQSSSNKKKIINIIDPNISNKDFVAHHEKLFNSNICKKFKTLRDFHDSLSHDRV